MMRNIISGIIAGIVTTATVSAQEQPGFYQPRTTTFWSDVRFGGGLGLAFGNGFSNISVAPSAIKPITEQLSAGVGLQFNYISSKDYFSSVSYGVNFLGLYNPIPELQLSAELEQLRVNNTIDGYYMNQYYYPEIKDNFWNTALFLGAGYSDGNVTVGIRYNVLFKEDNFVYSQAWMPFVRVYF
ncbi:MAG TPA: hypothetical protein VKY82_01620 [Flavobacterium sp.]|nr:hypothetical protein [Flavobacterium sp.]